MDQITSFSHSTGIKIIEDCAQSHGARWGDGTSIGTHAELATYSFQDTKALTCGEGGCVVGDDPELYERLQSIRADSRTIPSTLAPTGNLCLAENGSIMGTNFGLSEPSAAIARAALLSLSAQVDQKEVAASVLDVQFANFGIKTILKSAQLSVRSVYEYGIFLPKDSGDIDSISKNLTNQLNTNIYRMDPPIHLSPLYQPQTNPSLAPFAATFRFRAGDFPVAEESWEALLMMHHSVLLGPLDKIHEIPTVIAGALE